MIDSQALFNDLPRAIQQALGDNEITYEQLEGYVDDALALLSHIPADNKVKEALAKLYAKGQAARLAGYAVSEDYIKQFHDLKDDLEKQYVDNHEPIEITTEENLVFTDEELEKW